MARTGGATGGVQYAAGALCGRLAILARYIGEPIPRAVKGIVEKVLVLKLNREKTRVVNLQDEGESLDFLGLAFGGLTMTCVTDWRDTCRGGTNGAVESQRGRVSMAPCSGQGWSTCEGSNVNSS